MVGMLDFSQHEMELLSRAKDILEKCPHCYLAGSLMLKLKGINLGRECSDLDFCVEDDYLDSDQRMLNGLYSIGQTSIFIPPFFQLSTKDYGDFVQLKMYTTFDKIDYFYVREKNKCAFHFNQWPDGQKYSLRMGFINDLMKKKEEIIENTHDNEIVEKHLRDLIIIDSTKNKIK